MSSLAAELEAAGNAGDTGLIEKRLPVFLEGLAELIEGIRAWEVAQGGGSQGAGEAAAGGGSPAALPLLRELAAALEVQKADEVDRILEELKGKPFDAKTVESLEKISDDVLMAEFGKALETVRTML